METIAAPWNSSGSRKRCARCPSEISPSLQEIEELSRGALVVGQSTSFRSGVAPTRARSTGIEMDPVKFRDDSAGRAFSAMLLRVTKTVQLLSTVTRG